MTAAYSENTVKRMGKYRTTFFWLLLPPGFISGRLCEVGTGNHQDSGVRVSVWIMISGKQNSRIGNREVPTPREVYPRIE